MDCLAKSNFDSQNPIKILLLKYTRSGKNHYNKGLFVTVKMMDCDVFKGLKRSFATVLQQSRKLVSLQHFAMVYKAVVTTVAIGFVTVCNGRKTLFCLKGCCDSLEQSQFTKNNFLKTSCDNLELSLFVDLLKEIKSVFRKFLIEFFSNHIFMTKLN